MFTYKEIEKDDLAALAAMYVETFNAPGMMRGPRRPQRSGLGRWQRQRHFTVSVRLRGKCSAV